MRILGVNGSGRVGGNTSVLVKAILDGAAEVGAETSLLELGSLNISGCDSCYACKKTRHCVIDDDMKQFYELAPTTDVLVLTSPIYLDHITAQLMTFIQRTYCYIGPNLEKCWPRKGVRAVLGITYGAGNPDMYDYVLDWLAERLKFYYDIPTIERFKIPSTRHEPIIERDHPELQRAYEFGKTLKA